MGYSVHLSPIGIFPTTVFYLFFNLLLCILFLFCINIRVALIFTKYPNLSHILTRAVIWVFKVFDEILPLFIENSLVARPFKKQNNPY